MIAEAGSAHGQERIRFDAVGDTRLQGDMDRLGQIAANLVGNALTHGSEAGTCSWMATMPARWCCG